jgi:hypothetical protein
MVPRVSQLLDQSYLSVMHSKFLVEYYSKLSKGLNSAALMHCGYADRQIFGQGAV